MKNISEIGEKYYCLAPLLVKATQSTVALHDHVKFVFAQFNLIYRKNF